ncbi:hypothetical protein [Nonomuraea longicatena]|uniref:hypothetical protein n=1 Tax=Nonomuraea longicatena TaxID=83682 RepID=UPI0031D88BFF
MSRPQARRRSSPLFFAIVALVAVLLLFLSVPGIGPAVRAARADGAPGVFTARTLACVYHGLHEECTWTGEFRADAGGRRQVSLYGSDRNSMRAGQEIRAVDVGRPSRVYGPGGSNEWIFTALLLAAGLALLGHALRRLTGRRRSPG